MALALADAFELQSPVRYLLRRTAGLGDVIQTTAIVRELHRRHRGMVLIDVMTAFPDVFRGNPHVRQTMAPNQSVSLDDYDHVINLDVAYERNRKIHVAHAYAHVALGDAGTGDLAPELFDIPAATAGLDAVRGAIGPRYVVLHARNAPLFPARNFPPAFWQAVVTGLLETPERWIVVVGGGNDYRIAGPRIVGCHDTLSVQEIAALIAGAEAFVGADGGLYHVAACTATPIVALFTCARHEQLRPLRPAGAFIPLRTPLPCYGCQNEEEVNPPLAARGCQRGDLACRDSIDPAQVVAAVDGLPAAPASGSVPESDGRRPVRPQRLFKALPVVRESLYLQYFPDSVYAFSDLPELDEVLARFVQGNEANNGGDIGRLIALLLNLHALDDQGVAGDVAELGVWRGNTAALLAAWAGQTGRQAFFLDTFAGFDERDARDDPAHGLAPGQFADTSLDAVRQHVGGGDHIHFLAGRFPDSATPDLAASRFALVHLDCDLHAPTRAGLEFFYPRLTPGGLLVVHDYANPYWPGVRQATDDFLAAHGENLVLLPDKSGSAMLRKRGPVTA